MTEMNLFVATISRALDKKNNGPRERELRDQAVGGCFDVRRWLLNMYSERQTYIHVEIAFPLSSITQEQKAEFNIKFPHATPLSECVLAFASFSDRGVVAQARPFTNPGYKFFHVNVSRMEFQQALAFALRQIGKPYDHTSASWRILVFPPNPSTKTYWCASLTHAILQHANILQHYPLNTLDCDDIIRLIEASPRVTTGILPRTRTLAQNETNSSLFVSEEQVRKNQNAMVLDIFEATDATCRSVSSPVPSSKSTRVMDKKNGKHEKSDDEDEDEEDEKVEGKA